MATTTNETGVLVIETNQGPRGTPGQGVPVGGTTGQFLKKKTGTDYDTEWSTSAATVTSINDIGDVVVTTPTNGQVLKYDSGTGMWVNGTDGGTTSIAWGSVTGTLSAQTDLQSALDGKSGTGHTHFGVYEPVFTKNTAFNKDFGTLVGTVCQGNDARLSDARTPVAHTHVEADITDLDKYTQSQVDTLLLGKSDTSHNHSGLYQPSSADLTAIDALAGTSGFLTKTAADTWALDTSTYSLSTHNHTGTYEPANANIQAHVSSTSNPHSVTAAQVGAYTSGAVDTLLSGKSDTSHSHTLDGLSDVAITTPTSGQVIKFNGTSWVNDTDVAGSAPAWGAISGTLSDQTDLNSALSGKSDTSHNHTGVYEPAFTKNTAFNKDFGSLVGTVCQGNDARLSDARTPTAHTHVEADITNLDKYTQSQVDTLLTGKSDTSHTHSGVYQPVPAAGTVQTTDATATVVQTIAIPSGAQRVVTIRVKAYEAATDALLWKTMTLGVKNIAGTASFVGGVDSAVGYDASASTWTVVAGVSSGNVTVTVTGEAAKTIDWASSVDTY